MRDLDHAHLLVSPMITSPGDDGTIIGLIFLARRGQPGYSSDELVRLGAVSEQIATLIDSTRRSKLRIALSERQNLIKDLHDSVSQKLYGLVTMTEAAQASLEAGGRVDLNQILTRMGENARQAVREMRLFLYQLRPADIEKDGLIGAIHHRLSAVEGRASVKARLLADDGILLSKDKEVALYYIAQEALNNIIRHAYAQSVLVTLKKSRQHVVLEIRDDGKGFDVGKSETGGMGLQNMRERTAQINGRLRIISRVGQGTRVIIMVPTERIPRPAQRRSSK
jgi:signal transduction histidine kinase